MIVVVVAIVLQLLQSWLRLCCDYYNCDCGYIVIIVVVGVTDAIMWIAIVAAMIFFKIIQNIQ